MESTSYGGALFSISFSLLICILAKGSMPKKKFGVKLWPFPLYFKVVWPKNGPSIGGTSPVSSELILTFLESGEQGEWD